MVDAVVEWKEGLSRGLSLRFPPQQTHVGPDLPPDGAQRMLLPHPASGDK